MKSDIQALERAHCPPCFGDCQQGRDCPAAPMLHTPAWPWLLASLSASLGLVGIGCLIGFWLAGRT